MILNFELMILGIVTVIYVCFLTIVGLKIVFTYLKVKNHIFLLAGLAVVTTAFAWLGVAVLFISVVIFDVALSMEVYFFCHGVPIPIGSIAWILTIFDLFEVTPKKKKWLKIIFITFWTSIKIIYIIFIFTDTTLLGTPINAIQVDYSSFSEIFLLIALIQQVTTTFLLGVRFWKSNEKKVKIRGKILTIAICIYTSVTPLEIFIPIIPGLILARIIVMIYSLLFYAGFIFPKRVERLFFKEENA